MHPQASYASASAPDVRGAHVIVVGNEKGGAGKSTVAMHLIVALLKMGRRVGAIDLDLRQRTLSRYIENRGEWSMQRGQALPMPHLAEVQASRARDRDQAESEESALFDGAILSRRASAPGLFSVGLMDQTCPPSTT